MLLNDCNVIFSTSLNVSSKFWSFINFPIDGCKNIFLASLILGNLFLRYRSPVPLSSIALINFFINPNLMCKRGRKPYSPPSPPGTCEVHFGHSFSMLWFFPCLTITLTYTHTNKSILYSTYKLLAEVNGKPPQFFTNIPFIFPSYWIFFKNNFMFSYNSSMSAAGVNDTMVIYFHQVDQFFRISMDEERMGNHPYVPRLLLTRKLQDSSLLWAWKQGDEEINLTANFTFKLLLQIAFLTFLKL